MWQKCDWKENLSHPATFLTYFCKQLYEWLTEDFAWEMIKVLKKIPASFSCPFRLSVHVHVFKENSIYHSNNNVII